MNATLVATGIKTGDSFSCRYLRPLSAEDKRTLERLIESTEARGGSAVKTTTDREVILRVFPRGEA